MQAPFLSSPIEFLKGVGPLKAELLKSELQIHTFQDLLHHYPFRYVDRTQFNAVKDIQSDEHYYQLKGIITSKEIIGQAHQKRLVMRFKDTTGTVELVWFKGIQWVEKSIQIGQEYIVYGKPQLFQSRFNFTHPDIESSKEDAEETKGLYPIYSTTEKLKIRGINGKTIAKLTKQLLLQLQVVDLPETLPEYIRLKFKLYNLLAAMQHIHFPLSEQHLLQATRRIKFEELFLIQLDILFNKTNKQQIQKGFVFQPESNLVTTMIAQLPFQLTGAQARVLNEIKTNISAGLQMNRLIQGDVGSGKTIIALLAMLYAIDNGFQTCLMAPTEILARQHFESISTSLETLGIEISLYTGSTRAAEKRKILAKLASGELKMIIGTHALIEDTVQFSNLGLAVVDEQHKFGVAQRASLWKKNNPHPHVLVMTATPIPRTLAMTLYGDLDCSVIDELPPGRKPIKTIHQTDSARLSVFELMKKEISKGRQIYVVYPLIEESEKLDYKDLMDGYESIVRAFPLPDYRVSIVHGRQKAEDKNFEMERFVKGETQIMVATTVIEVGVNVPNASVMVIESAERFGLSQLHQLSGRVGRGAEQSLCILMTGFKLSQEGRLRMSTMVKTNDGFEIADVDLQIRGPGDIQGTQQSGILDLRLANLAKDVAILQAARDTVTQILEADSKLEMPENNLLKVYFERKKQSKNNWSRIS
jgi:ATP-dependent DNA helicase RecG